MLRRLYHDQPEHFTFTPDNAAWAEAQITKYPEGRQASAVIPLLWRAQEQEGWLSRPAIEAVAAMLGMAYIRVLEVATFYFMFQLQPVGAVAHIQVCGTTSCMICGAEDLIAVCKARIAPRPHMLSADGALSWEEVECLGACANAPMAQIGKDYYEDLTTGRLGEILDALRAGEVPTPGPQNGRFASEPLGGLTSLTAQGEDRAAHNASVGLAVEIGDTVRRIDGTEVPLRHPWLDARDAPSEAEERAAKEAARSDAPDPATMEDEKIARPREGDVAPDAKAAPDAAARGAKAASDAKAAPDANDAPDANNAPEAPTSPEAKAAPDTVAGRAGGDAPAAGTGTGRGSAVGADVAAIAPDRLAAPRDGVADDLTRIGGIGPKLRDELAAQGVYHFDQIASWSVGHVAWMDRSLGFKGRVSRDDWVGQARALRDESSTEPDDGDGT